MEPEVNAKRHALETFAKQIATRVEAARVSGAFEQLILVAGPELLGILRHSLSDAARKLVIREVAKNVMRLGPEGIREHLA